MNTKKFISNNGEPRKEVDSTNANAAEASKFRQRVEEGKLVTLDCGKNNATLYDGNDTPNEKTGGEGICESVSPLKILEIASNPKYKGYSMVAEDAHFGVPRSEDSLAQPFIDSQLTKFYKDCRENEVILRLFPQKSTPRAASYAGLEKSDETDPISIYKMVRDFPSISLRKPPESFKPSDLRKEGYEHKKKLNKKLNFARRFDYSDTNGQWIKDNIKEISSSLSSTAQDAFQIDEQSITYKKGNKKKGLKKGDINYNNINLTQLCTVLGSLRGKMDIDPATGQLCIFDKLIKREHTKDKDLIKWKFAKKHVFCFSPMHQRGGVARSNLMHHGARNYIIRKAKEDGLTLNDKVKDRVTQKLVTKGRGDFSKEEDKAFVSHRKAYSNSVKEVFNLFRNMLTK
jgi:hypothetical protein